MKWTTHIPDSAIDYIDGLLDHDGLTVVVKPARKTRHGDYKLMPDGRHQITINNNLNPYRFLLTLVHEIAHFDAFLNYGRTIKPHGKEWKLTFRELMLPLINPQIFPDNLLPLVAKHFKNPKASSDTDVELAYALKAYDPPNDAVLVRDVPYGVQFSLYNGKIFSKGHKRVKRYACVEIKTGKLYLFNPNAEVHILNDIYE